MMIRISGHVCGGGRPGIPRWKSVLRKSIASFCFFVACKTWPGFVSCSIWRPQGTPEVGSLSHDAADTAAAEAARDVLSAWLQEVKSLIETAAYGVRGVANDVVDGNIVEEALGMTYDIHDQLQKRIAEEAKASEVRIAQAREKASQILERLQKLDLSSISSSIQQVPARELRELLSLLAVPRMPSLSLPQISISFNKDTNSETDENNQDKGAEEAQRPKQTASDATAEDVEAEIDKSQVPPSDDIVQSTSDV
ncbi:hypothetical protein TGRUB_268790 [Toxoplasma gondii RUB]|uniref:Uncharacterized protein n=1 Tax=Toxoplasma gondii RUB TaxID=935652 RepID=A0A086LXN4_TOXGO|nr:hypothetical protein TGRUB_268790 [Toxoplasma gondii RUB]